MKDKFDSRFKIVKLSAIVVAIFVLIICCFTLTACDPVRIRLGEEDLTDIACVELIRYDYPNQKRYLSWVPDYTSDLKSFDDSKQSVLETLEEDKTSQFIDAISNISIADQAFSCDSPNGICIKIAYSGGDFLILHGKESSSRYFGGYICKFSSDGEVARYIGNFTNSNFFATIVNSFFTTQI